jgi:hypothetical protein
LDIEGTLNGNFDSQITLPLATGAPAISGLTPNTGPVGSSVVIAGTNFRALQGSSTVTFNGISSTPTAWTSTSITAPVPSGATTGPVVVSVGGQASSGVTFTVTVPPGISGLLPNSGVAGSIITITGANFGATQGGGSVTFNGATAVVSSWSNTRIVATAPIGATTGPLVVTAGNGTSGNAQFTVFNPNGVSVDQIVSGSDASSNSTISTPSFSTNSGNELLLAFLSTAPGISSNSIVTSMAGGGLTWVLVQRTNVQSGTAEVWRAFASSPLSNITVAATLSQASDISMSVVSFMGVDTSGTNGSGAIGATAVANASSGAPSAALTTTRKQLPGVWSGR